MDITHKQAHRLIQLALDHALNREEQAALSAHLPDCVECQAYASEMREVESILPPLMKRTWTLRPSPLPIAPLIQKKTSAVQPRILLAMRTLAISLGFLALVIGSWPFLDPGSPTATRAPLAVPLVPTPSAQVAPSTSTRAQLEDCEVLLYRIQPGDTLSDLAGRFSVSAEQIMEFNGLTNGTLREKTELLIPVCHLTPTGTAHPATFTATYTPGHRPGPSMPGSRY